MLPDMYQTFVTIHRRTDCKVTLQFPAHRHHEIKNVHSKHTLFLNWFIHSKNQAASVENIHILFSPFSPYFMNSREKKQHFPTSQCTIQACGNHTLLTKCIAFLDNSQNNIYIMFSFSSSFCFLQQGMQLSSTSVSQANARSWVWFPPPKNCDVSFFFFMEASHELWFWPY